MYLRSHRLSRGLLVAMLSGASAVAAHAQIPSRLQSSPQTATPGTKPTVRNMIDYHGSRVGLPLDWIGFSYDDVPFEFTA